MADETKPSDPAVSRYSVLPEQIRIADTIASVETRPVPDPTMGRDSETEWMLRNAG